MNLYPWQEDCIRHWWSNQGRGIVQAITGSGKTRLALASIHHLKKQLNTPLKVKIVVPTGNLMYQWKNALKDFLTLEAGVDNLGSIGLWGNGHKSLGDYPYMIYVINSARYQLAREILSDLKEGYGVFLIADECHHYTSSQNSLIFEFLPYIEEYSGFFYSLGLTATLPVGHEKQLLVSSLGKVIYHYTLRDASNSNTICPYDIFHITLSFDSRELWEYEELSDKITFLYRRLLSHASYLKHMGRSEQFKAIGELTGSHISSIARMASSYLNLSYKRKSLICLANSRITCALNLIRLLSNQSRIIIFSERIQQAEELYQALEAEFPGQIGRYHSQLGSLANQNNLQRFKDGEYRILISCKALDEGLDVPDASVGIILSGTSMERQRIQRLGRIIRKKTGKERALLYYLHIVQSNEDQTYLPFGDHRILELGYDSFCNVFTNPSYDKAVEKLLDDLNQKAVDQRILNEYSRCIRLGRVRSDWLNSPSVLQTEIENAKGTAERNYFICIKNLHSFLD